MESAETASYTVVVERCFLSFLLSLHSLRFHTSHQSGPPEASFIDPSVHSLIHSVIHPQGPQSVSNQRRIKHKLCQLILRSLSIQLCPHNILTPPRKSSVGVPVLPKHLNLPSGSCLCYCIQRRHPPFMPPRLLASSPPPSPDTPGP